MLANSLEYACLFQVALCLVVLFAMVRRGVLRDFAALAAYVALDGLYQVTRVSVLFFRANLHLSRLAAFLLYFYSSWVAGVGLFVLAIFILYGLFAGAMRPFPGLQRIGVIVFRWVGVVSLAVAIALATGPQLMAKGTSPTQVVTDLASRFQQGIGVLVLCLLIFVCFAIRPLGLTFRSYIFGVVLGLAVISTVNLVQAAWLATVGAQSLYSPVYVFSEMGVCVGILVWGVYFAMPEPARKMILLPTTSPFFLWNRISEVLGDAPGQVAVAGFSPEMLAPAEIEMLTAATSREAAAARARETEARELDFREPDLLSAPFPQSLRHELPEAGVAAFALSR